MHFGEIRVYAKEKARFSYAQPILISRSVELLYVAANCSLQEM